MENDFQRGILYGFVVACIILTITYGVIINRMNELHQEEIDYIEDRINN